MYLPYLSFFYILMQTNSLYEILLRKIEVRVVIVELDCLYLYLDIQYIRMVVRGSIGKVGSWRKILIRMSVCIVGVILKIIFLYRKRMLSLIVIREHFWIVN